MDYIIKNYKGWAPDKNNVLEKFNPACLSREQVKKAVDGLICMQYKFRIVEKEKTENVM